MWSVLLCLCVLWPELEPVLVVNVVSGVDVGCRREEREGGG